MERKREGGDGEKVGELGERRVWARREGCTTGQGLRLGREAYGWPEGGRGGRLGKPGGGGEWAAKAPSGVQWWGLWGALRVSGVWSLR